MYNKFFSVNISFLLRAFRVSADLGPTDLAPADLVPAEIGPSDRLPPVLYYIINVNKSTSLLLRHLGNNNRVASFQSTARVGAREKRRHIWLEKREGCWVATSVPAETTESWHLSVSSCSFKIVSLDRVCTVTFIRDLGSSPPCCSLLFSSALIVKNKVGVDQLILSVGVHILT